MYSLMPSTILILLPFLFSNMNSVLFFWMSLEISTMMYLYTILSEKESKKSDSLMIYFLIQSLASSLLLMTIFSVSFYYSKMMMEAQTKAMLIVMLIMSVKIAVAPFHFWLIKMLKYLSWTMLTMLLTWQKLIPLLIICFFPSYKFIFYLCMMTLMISTLSQLKILVIKSLMVYSSIAHLGWMLILITKSKILPVMYLMGYSVILISLILFFLTWNFLYLFEQISTKMLISMSVAIFSLSGIPPLMGFVLKWLSLTSLLKTIMLATTFLLMACLSFYIYSRMIYKSILWSSMTFKTKNKKNFSIMLWMVNLFIPFFILFT